MDIAAFKVSHYVGSDIDATTALRAARAGSSSYGHWKKGLGKGRRRAHISPFVRIHGSVGQRCRAINEESPALPVARARSVSIGAMDEMSQKVQ